jgi:DNA-binding transcriptional LysR family regulator
MRRLVQAWDRVPEQQPEAVPPSESPSTESPPSAARSLSRAGFTLEQIRTFVAVAAREHIGQTASAIGVSQAAVTQKVQLLERALGITLLERRGRRVRLTDAGAAAAGACLVVMKGIDALEQVALSARTDETGTLCVGASHTAASLYLPIALRAFTRVNSAVEVDVVVGNTSNICEAVARGVLDCGLVEGPMARQRLLAVPVAEDEVVLVVHGQHPLATAQDMQELLPHRYVSGDAESSSEAAARARLGPAYDRLVRLQGTAPDAVRAALLAGLGFGAVPLAAVRGELESGCLVQLPVAPYRRWVYAIRRGVSGSPVVEAFWPTLTGELLCDP